MFELIEKESGKLEAKEPSLEEVSPRKCKHETLELIEKDGKTVWLRCSKCFVLFKKSQKELDKYWERVKE